MLRSRALFNTDSPCCGAEIIIFWLHSDTDHELWLPVLFKILKNLTSQHELITDDGMLHKKNLTKIIIKPPTNRFLLFCLGCLPALYPLEPLEQLQVQVSVTLIITVAT